MRTPHAEPKPGSPSHGNFSIAISEEVNGVGGTPVMFNLRCMDKYRLQVRRFSDLIHKDEDNEVVRFEENTARMCSKKEKRRDKATDCTIPAPMVGTLSSVPPAHEHVRVVHKKKTCNMCGGTQLV